MPEAVVLDTGLGFQGNEVNLDWKNLGIMSGNRTLAFSG